MELREFVKDALVAIVEGVRDAQKGLDVNINPRPSVIPDKRGGEYMTMDGLRATPVQFDVAVTISAEANAEGGGKVSIWSIASSEGKTSAKDGESTVSRLQFQVPVAFPYADRS
jgi:hypothetical protein